MTLRSRILLYLVTALAVFTHHALAAVLAIDYGADWIKASLMKPGVPFDVLLNRDSKRKIQSSVAWKGEDRLFGGDAANVAGRFPQDSFSSLKFLQAAPYDADVVAFYATISTGETEETSRGTVALRRPDGTTWAVEELVAMQLAYVKDLAEALAGERIVDTVVTVPPFYSQFERDALADAVEVAGLRTLALVNDGAAVAVNYAMTRTFATPEYHVMYDAGASAIRATVVQFATIEGKKKADAHTQLTVAGVGYDRGVGGTELDRRLRDLLLADFEAKHKKDLRSDKRGMARLWKEASRVKAILSANADSRVTVESIAWDIDYKSKMTREQFENACGDLKPKFIAPITDAIANAGLTLDQITSIILTGGASRTPMIKDAVTRALGADKIAVNVNADEAAVLGAAFYGAGLSRQFKTKDIRVQDITVHDVIASYPAEKRGKTLSATIFPSGAKTGTRKTMTFKRKEDFPLTLAYKGSPAPGFPIQILEAHISGIPEAVKNLTDLGASDVVVKAMIALSESGFASVKEAYVIGELKEDESFTGKLKGLFGGGSSSESSSDGSSSSGTTSSTASSASGSASASDAAAEKKKPSVKEEKIPLTIDVKFITIPPMTVAEKRAARDRLWEIDNQESAKRANEDARNTLESYLYRLRDLLGNENAETPFMKCSKSPERQAISARLSDAFEWMHEHADTADTATLLKQRRDLEALEAPVIHRYKEIEEFPQALNNSQMWNWSTRLFITEAQANYTVEEKTGGPFKYTQEELAALEKRLVEHETWLNIHVEKQKATPLYEDPAVETSEMKRRAEVLSQELQKLVRRKAPTKPKKTTSKSSSATTASGAQETSSPSASASTSPSSHEEL